MEIIRDGLKMLAAVVAVVVVAAVLSIGGLALTDYLLGNRHAEAKAPTSLPSAVTRFHDDELGVTCWYTAWGMSCISDAALPVKIGR